MPFNLNFKCTVTELSLHMFITSFIDGKSTGVERLQKDFTLHPGWCGSGTECQPANQRVAGLIPSRGTCLGCVTGPRLGACVSLTNQYSLLLFLPLFPSL